MGFWRTKPTAKELEQCKSCSNAFVQCDTCTPGNRNYEKIHADTCQCSDCYHKRNLTGENPNGSIS